MLVYFEPCVRYVAIIAQEVGPSRGVAGAPLPSRWPEVQGQPEPESDQDFFKGSENNFKFLVYLSIFLMKS